MRLVTCEPLPQQPLPQQPLHQQPPPPRHGRKMRGTAAGAACLLTGAVAPVPRSIRHNCVADITLTGRTENAFAVAGNVIGGIKNAAGAAKRAIGRSNGECPTGNQRAFLQRILDERSLDCAATHGFAPWEYCNPHLHFRHLRNIIGELSLQNIAGWKAAVDTLLDESAPQDHFPASARSGGRGLEELGPGALESAALGSSNDRRHGASQEPAHIGALDSLFCKYAFFLEAPPGDALPWARAALGDLLHLVALPETAAPATLPQKMGFEKECARFSCAAIAGHIALYLLIEGIIGADATGIQYVKGGETRSGGFGGVADKFNAWISPLEECIALSARNETSRTTLERVNVPAAIPATNKVHDSTEVDRFFRTCLAARDVTSQDVVEILYLVLPYIKQLSGEQIGVLFKCCLRVLNNVNASRAAFTSLANLFDEIRFLVRVDSFTFEALKIFFGQYCDGAENTLLLMDWHLQEPSGVRYSAEFGELGILLQYHRRAQLRFVDIVRLVGTRSKMERDVAERDCLDAPRGSNSPTAGLCRIALQATLGALATSLVQDCLRGVAALLLEVDARKQYRHGAASED